MRWVSCPPVVACRTGKPDTMTLPTGEQILEALKSVVDPEIALSIVDLGLVYDVDVQPSGKVGIRMTLTTPACPYGEILLTNAQKAAEKIEGVTEVQMILVWDPPWDPDTMASDTAKDALGIW